MDRCVGLKQMTVKENKGELRGSQCNFFSYGCLEVEERKRIVTYIYIYILMVGERVTSKKQKSIK